jgi:nucleotide-binding universal stress UspA family protein
LIDLHTFVETRILLSVRSGRASRLTRAGDHRTCLRTPAPAPGGSLYKRILTVVDSRPFGRAAVREGTAMAKAHGADLVFFSVLPRYQVPIADTPPFLSASPQDFLDAARADADAALAAAKASAGRAGVPSSVAVGTGGDDVACVVDAARQRRCDLIVVASEGRNALLRLLTGSMIPGLITSSPVPVLVCTQRPRGRAGVSVPAGQPRRVRTKARRAVAAGT